MSMWGVKSSILKQSLADEKQQQPRGQLREDANKMLLNIRKVERDYQSLQPKKGRKQ